MHSVGYQRAFSEGGLGERHAADRWVAACVGSSEASDESMMNQSSELTCLRIFGYRMSQW